MPELPEVQTIVDELSNQLVGRMIKSCRIYRKSVLRGNPIEFRNTISGQHIKSVQRRGKYILIFFSPRIALVAHLRMTGKFILQKKNRKTMPHDRVSFMLDGDLKLIFSDVRCFGTLELVDTPVEHAGIRQLGIEPWDRKLTTSYLQNRLKNRSVSIKTALLDQKLIAGLGNIYASEILFHAGIAPVKASSDLNEKQLRRIIRSMREILTQALKYNGTSISDYRRIDEKQGMFQNFLKVYGKAGEKCLKCTTIIEKIVQNQRSTFFCPRCQR